MFSHIIVKSSTSVASKVTNLVGPMPVDSTYDQLKMPALKRISSDEAHLQRLLAGAKLYDYALSASAIFNPELH